MLDNAALHQHVEASNRNGYSHIIKISYLGPGRDPGKTNRYSVDPKQDICPAKPRRHTSLVTYQVLNCLRPGLLKKSWIFKAISSSSFQFDPQNTPHT